LRKAQKGFSFSTQLGLVFAKQGCKIAEKDVDMTFDLNYFQVPFYVVFKSNGEQAKFILQAGGYLGLCLGGKMSASAGQVSASQKLKVGTELGMFDLGLGTGAGVQFGNSFQVMLDFKLGVANVLKGDDYSDGGIANNGMYITATYLFGNPFKR
jgi:hypothetical protein